jgi:alpha-methylacyl-CoA racemase
VNLLDSGAPFYDVYEAADGQHVAVAPIEPRFYGEFVRRLGLEGQDLPAQWDARAWPRLRERLAAVFRTRTRDEWARVFEGSDACVAPVLSLREAAESDHARARATYVADGDGVQPAPAPRFSRTPGAIRHGPPAFGRDTRSVLAEAGFEANTIDRLLQEGIVRGEPA